MDYEAFVTESYEAVEQARGFRLRICGRRIRRRVAELVIRHWQEDAVGSYVWRDKLFQRVRRALQREFGSIWLMLAVSIIKLVIEIFLERWFFHERQASS